MQCTSARVTNFVPSVGWIPRGRKEAGVVDLDSCI